MNNSVKMKRQPTVWNKIFANDIFDKGVTSRMYEELSRFNSRMTNSPIRKWVKDMKRHFMEEDMPVTNMQMKDVKYH